MLERVRPRSVKMRQRVFQGSPVILETYLPRTFPIYDDDVTFYVPHQQVGLSRQNQPAVEEIHLRRRQTRSNHFPQSGGFMVRCKHVAGTEWQTSARNGSKPFARSRS